MAGHHLGAELAVDTKQGVVEPPAGRHTADRDTLRAWLTKAGQSTVIATPPQPTGGSSDRLSSAALYGW